MGGLFRSPELRSLIKPYRWRVVLLCLSGVLLSTAQVLLALLTRQVIDAAVYARGDLALWGILLAVDLAVMVALNSFNSWLAGATADACAFGMRRQLLRSAVYSHDLRLQQFHSGQLLSRGMEDVNTVTDGFVSALPALISQVTRLAAAFGAVFLIAPPVAGILAAAAVAVIGATALIRPLLKRHHRRVRRADEQVLSALQEDLQQLELIQSLDAQVPILDTFGKRVDGNLQARRKRRLLSVTSGSLMNIGLLTGTGVLLLWGAVQVAQKAMTYGSLTAMIQLLSQFSSPVLGLSGLWTRLTAVDVAGERLSDLLTAPQLMPRQPVGRVRAVVFRDVTFTYPGENAPVLSGFSARFPLEQWACLTGISGKGKTTLFKLILGLYAPQSGQVILETDSGDVVCGEDTRHLFAYVPQDFALFSGTVLENLQLVSGADGDKRREALDMAQAGFLWETIAGEQTPLGENNTGLSKGQLQRIAIARAILMERPILLLDECTSALDSATETAVLKSLHALGKQAILVTHRPEALQDIPGILPVCMED